MSRHLILAHLLRSWREHGRLQIATVVILSLVLMVFNFLQMGMGVFNQAIAKFGSGMEMIVYLRDEGEPNKIEQLQSRLRESQDFPAVRFVAKSEATKKFLTKLGNESLQLLNDPKWSSPIPASFELTIASSIPVDERIGKLSAWAGELKGMSFVEDVFYGQGWIENFARFMNSMNALVLFLFLLCVGVGMLIIGNCIRLSYHSRHDEIAVLELVGGTPTFIRTPFVIEGACLGFVAAIVAIGLSGVLHSLVLDWMGKNWSFWIDVSRSQPLPVGTVALALAMGIGSGTLGAWLCIRKMNTGWAAVE